MEKTDFDGMLGTLTAEGLDQLIKRAAFFRAQREPAVVRDIAKLETVLVQYDPQFAVAKAEDGRVALHIRHDGLGWIHLSFEPRRAAYLRDAFSRRLVGVDVGGFEAEIPGPDQLQ